MNPPTDHHPALGHSPQGQGYQFPRWGKNDRGVQFFRPCLRGVTCPLRSHLQGERLRGEVPRPRVRKDPAALVPGHLGHDMGRGSVAVYAQPLRVASHGQRPVANEAGAE